LSCFKRCKILNFGRKTLLLLLLERRWIGLSIGLKGAKFYEVWTTFYGFLLSSSWANWYFKHLWMCMAWIVKSWGTQEIARFYRKFSCKWFPVAISTAWAFFKSICFRLKSENRIFIQCDRRICNVMNNKHSSVAIWISNFITFAERFVYCPSSNQNQP